jgi:hypothetical protein
VSSTEVVAIIGAGSTFGVAVAGYLFSYFTAQREADAQRARDDQQREHERELARGARLFDRRAPVYEEMLKFLNVWRDRVYATERIWESAGDPGPPEPPNFDEWRAMQARLGTYGSAAVVGCVSRVLGGNRGVLSARGRTADDQARPRGGKLGRCRGQDGGSSRHCRGDAENT